jgi:hypothetical protein
MKGTVNNRQLLASLLVAGVVVVGGDARAEPAKAEAAATIGGGAVARILPPAEKIKVLEDELAKETERRAKAEEDLGRRIAENSELGATSKVVAKERAALEVRLGELREREAQLQRINDRLRAENERIAVTVRLSLPLVAAVAIAILAMLVYTFLFLRKIAARVHTQRTLSEMHEIETRLTHVTDQYNAEVKRNQTLRHKLAELGIVD